MADSNGFAGASPAAEISAAWSRVILPVVIRDQERSIAVAKFQRRIGQRIRYTQRSKAGADAAHDDIVRYGAVAEQESGDHDVIAGADKGARA